jgi:D-beta-D-heptose 7-phosphate kinase/D-beta-D-heptose 1-phosphate adenosyltransferase
MHVLITGGFDPVHSGHINAFNKAAGMGKLTVGLNSDAWLVRKKQAFLLPYLERRTIIKHLNMVSNVLEPWNDSDGSACVAIQIFYNQYKESNSTMLFVNGGDRVPSEANQQEFDLCTSLGILSVFGSGGTKTASSSNFLGDYVSNITRK